MISYIYKGPQSDHLVYYCPGCERKHNVPVEINLKVKTKWNWNGSLTAPTLQPSVKETSGPFPDGHVECCHTILTDGVLAFQNDCTHKLKSQIVPLPPVEYGLDPPTT